MPLAEVFVHISGWPDGLRALSKGRCENREYYISLAASGHYLFPLGLGQSAKVPPRRASNTINVCLS